MVLAGLLAGSQPPIEEAFSKIKAHLKKAAARTKEALDAIRCEEQGLQYSANEQWNKIFGSFFTG